MEKFLRERCVLVSANNSWKLTITTGFLFPFCRKSTVTKLGLKEICRNIFLCYGVFT